MDRDVDDGGVARDDDRDDDEVELCDDGDVEVRDDVEPPRDVSRDVCRDVSRDDVEGPREPAATHPTVVLAIPFPPLMREARHAEKVPPFVLYAPLGAALAAPGEGESESVVHKARRRWEESSRAAEGGKGIKARVVGLIGKGMQKTKNSKVEFLVRTPSKNRLSELRIVYPASYSAEHITQLFTDLVKNAKSGALRNGVVSTAILPFVLAFDTLTLVPGPFEINAVWASASWTAAARASSLSRRLASHSLPISLAPDPALDPVRMRLAELCWRKVGPRAGVPVPSWGVGGETPTPAHPHRTPPLPARPTRTEHDTPAYTAPHTPPLPARPSTHTPPPLHPASHGHTPPPNIIPRNADLGALVLGVLIAHGEDPAGLERERTRVGADVERCLRRGVGEWGAVL